MNPMRSAQIATVLLMAALGLPVERGPFAQAANPSQTESQIGGSRIAGTIVSKTDGHPLARARITLRDVKNPQKSGIVITADDGKFQFTGIPAGKYSLGGSKKGFITAGYDQHDFFSTAIVTGAGLDTENLILKLAPGGVIAGKVLDEVGDPVRHAMVTLYFDNHMEGVDQIQVNRNAQTDDLGNYEISPLMPGTYFLSASATPWYAVHPQSEPPDRKTHTADSQSTIFDRSLDVAYPTTYYADVTDTDSATPIPVRGGERLQVDIHLNPVPALRLIFHVPGDGRTGYAFPRLEHPAFDGSTFLQTGGIRMISPGVVELSGVPAGRYDIRLQGPGSSAQMTAVDLTKDGEEIDASAAESLVTVKISALIAGEPVLPKPLAVGLSNKGRTMMASMTLDAKGEAEFQPVPAGRYEVLIWGARKTYSILRLSAEGADVSGRSLIVKAGSPASVSMTLTSGSGEIEGIVKRAGKPFAGAMAVLVPKEPEGHSDLFYRDQSDLDGTFAMHNVVPGFYTIVAIENGWDLDWSQPGVIAAYAKHGRKVEVSDQPGKPLILPEPVELQSK
jgi:hypothetical protein